VSDLDRRAPLASIYGGRPWIVALDVLAGATPVVRALRELGAARALCIATSRGTGALPDAEFAPDPIVIEVDAPDMMTGIRRSGDVLANLPSEAVARVDAFDPERRARVLGGITSDARPVAGRKRYGARPAAWEALEDKTRVDAFWDAAGVAHAPSRVVPARRDALEAARVVLDRGLGCAVAGDNREGYNGGASYLRWARSPDELVSVADFFEAHCDRARVMPFIEGIPCSIHGIVFPEHVVVLRPCELLVFRRPGSSELHYGRAASFWDPPDADREAMREVARRTGNHLRRSVGYRGAFTVDGILGHDGFVPTELNPRLGAGLFVLATGLELRLELFNAAVVEGEPVEWQPRKLEERWLELADCHRSGAGFALTSVKQTETRSTALVWTGDAFRIARDDETADANALLGPSALGGFLKLELVPERTPVGPPAAPRVALGLACAGAHFGLDLGTLEPARDVRSR
jgi:hypothetical protein